MSGKKTINLQNLTRGVVAVSRSHDFRKNGITARHQLQASIRQTLIKAGTQIFPSQYSEYVTWADKLISSLAPGVDPLAAPDYLSLSHLYEISGAEWGKTLAWVEARLTPHIEQLKAFFKECAEVEKLALCGDVEKATVSLVSIEKKFGASIHLVELRIALAQLRGGVDSQKRSPQKCAEQGRAD